MNRQTILSALASHGWQYLRHAKGSHQIWMNCRTGRKLTISGLHTSRDFTRNAARKTLSKIKDGAIA